MDAQEKRLREWLKSQAYRTSTDDIDEDEIPITGLVVRHVGSGNKLGQEVSAHKLNSAFTDEMLDGLCADISTACQNDAEGLGGVQKYIVLPMYGKKSRPNARFILRVRAQEAEDNEGENLDTEPPNRTGVTGMLMRHLEATQRVSMSSVAQMLTIQQRTIQRQSEQIEAMVGKHVEMLETVEELVQMKHERELEMKEASVKAEAKQRAVDEAMGLIPVVKAKLLGKAAMAQLKPSPPEELLMKLLTSLNGNQVDSIMGQLSDVQKTQMMELYQLIASRGNDDAGKNGAS